MRFYTYTVFCSSLTFYIIEDKDKRNDLRKKLKDRKVNIWRIGERQMQKRLGEAGELSPHELIPGLRENNKIRWDLGKKSLLLMLRSKPGRRNAVPK